MAEKLHSSLDSANLKFLPAALQKAGFVLEPLISDTDYFQHPHRAAASPVLFALYSVPEPILAQLPETVVVYTYDTQSKALDFSRINTENVLCLVLFGFFFKSQPRLLSSPSFLDLFSKLSILFYSP